MCIYKTEIIYNVDHMNLSIQEVNFQVHYSMSLRFHMRFLFGIRSIRILSPRPA